MAFFLAFLVLAIVFVPMITLSQMGRARAVVPVRLDALIRHARDSLTFLVIALIISTLAVCLIDELTEPSSFPELETTLRLICLSILAFMTLKRTLRPGPVTIYRVMGGIAGYLLIGYAWTFAYQLVLQQIPGAIHIGSVPNVSWRQPNHLIYFSFITLTTVGYGDAYPVHPVVRSLAVAEALVGQLYLAILIGSLVGMALQSRSGQTA